MAEALFIVIKKTRYLFEISLLWRGRSPIGTFLFIKFSHSFASVEKVWLGQGWSENLFVWDVTFLLEKRHRVNLVTKAVVRWNLVQAFRRKDLCKARPICGFGLSMAFVLAKSSGF